MRRRALGCLVATVIMGSVGLAWAPAHAAPTGFTCDTSIGASPATLSGSAIVGFTYTADATCDAPMAVMVISSRVIGSSGAVEAARTTDGCSQCAGVATAGAVPVVVPASRHRLLVDLTETAPPGEMWQSLDAGPNGSCTGGGTTTARCSWNFPLQQTVGPPVTVAVQSTESGVADTGQGVLDQFGVD